MRARLPTAEAELLLGRVCAPGTGGGAPPPPAAEIDWLAVARLAERENLLGVLWPALSSSRASIPDTVAGAMRRQAHVSEFRMATLEGQLARVVQRLDDHDIPVMLMKGAALAVTRYGSFARRPMGDLDLLVHEDQVERAWELLRSDGWTPEREGADAFYDEHQHLCPLVAPGGANVVVELHRCLLYPHGPFQLLEADVWAAAAPVEVGGRTAWVPAPEYLMLHLCIHFAWSHEMRFGLGRTVRDLAVLAPVVDWERLIELARATRAKSSCYWTIRLAMVAAGVAVPPAAVAGLAPWLPEWLRRALQRIVLTEALDPRADFVPSVRLRRLAWALAIRPGASGHGAARPWNFRADFGKYTQGAPPAPLLRRVRGQVALLPGWARFVAIAAGLGWPGDRRSRGS
jgi:Uncharacterised nucleotidyltransferase